MCGDKSQFHLRKDGDPELGTGLADPVVQRVRHPQGELDLDGSDLGDLDGLADGVGVDLGERDATDLARLRVAVEEAQRVEVVGLGHPAAHLEHVDLGLGADQAQTVLDALTDVSWGVVADQARSDAALDVDADLLGILRVLVEVLLQERQGVVLQGRPVHLAAVPRIGAMVQRRLHERDLLFLGRLGGGVPGQAHETVADGANLLAENRVSHFCGGDE